MKKFGTTKKNKTIKNKKQKTKNKKQKIQMKKLIKYVFVIILILGFGIYGFNMYYFEILKPKDSQIIKTNFGELYYTEGIVTKDSIQLIVNLLEQSFAITNENLGLESDNSLKILYSFGEKKISSAYPNFKTISYYHFNSIYPPYIHEYIHTQFGIYKEYWFTEGYATYLSLKIKDDNPNLKSIYDINDNWFQKIEGNEYVCDIEDLKEKYNIEQVRTFMNLENNKPKLKTLKEKVDYYKLSASFCEYLSNEIGFSEFLGLIKKSRSQSIKTILKQSNVNIESKYNDWLAENFK